MDLDFDIDMNNNEKEESFPEPEKDPLEQIGKFENLKQESSMEDFYQTTLNDYDEFDRKAWEKKKGYSIPNYPDIETKLEGLESGLYLFAAESNVGKSAIMMNMIHSICSDETNKLFGVYYSLDDSMFEIIPRIVAMDQLIPISVVSKPQRYQDAIDNAEEGSSDYQTMLDKRSAGLEKLKELNEHFKIVDSNKIHNAKELYEHIKNVIVYVKSFDPSNNVIIAIDSINDIKIEGKFNSTADKNSEIAKMVKDWTTEFNIPIFASTHLRKLNANRRPINDDLKESGEYVYEASVVWLLYNDVSKNKQSAKIYYNSESGEKQPIIEIDWAKNKKSSYKGRSYCFFSPEYSRATECNADVSKRFDALIYEN